MFRYSNSNAWAHNSLHHHHLLHCVPTELRDVTSIRATRCFCTESIMALCSSAWPTHAQRFFLLLTFCPLLFGPASQTDAGERVRNGHNAQAPDHIKFAFSQSRSQSLATYRHPIPKWAKQKQLLAAQHCAQMQQETTLLGKLLGRYEDDLLQEFVSTGGRPEDTEKRQALDPRSAVSAVLGHPRSHM